MRKVSFRALYVLLYIFVALSGCSVPDDPEICIPTQDGTCDNGF